VDPKFFKGVKILNLAFDMVPAKYVTTYITEKGPISPKKYTPMAIKQIKHLLD
jgi:translation initiation factor 2B subunit (eIF-2B alpha/beta/delta family)